MPITIRKSGVQEIEFKDLKNNHSTSLHHQQLCVEMCSNPAWYAIQALPYMMEYPNECSEQIFTRLYANSIAMNLANKNPEINKVYLSWQNQSEKGKNLQSKLLMNQDLKYAMIEETPWLNDAKNESERIQKLGILFNSITMNKEINHAYEQLKEIQSDNGSWPWFKGMQPNNYITQTIVIGFGKMKKMGVDIKPYLAMIEKAINFLDNEALNDYERFQKYDSTKFFQGEKLQYLYCKSFFPTMGFSINNEVIRYFIHASEKQWVSNSMLNQAQLAIALHILKPDSKIPPLILKSFNEMSIQSEEQGMYWPSNSGGWYWYQAPLETQCAVIELYQLMGKDEEKVKEQQIWLMRQKQTQNWSTTRSTADACYALLSSNNLLNNKQQITVSVDSKPLVPESIEQGTGYFRQNVQKETISNSSANINIKSAVSGFSYGAVYWQYFEENDKISVSGSGLKIEKKLFKLVDTEIGLEKIEIKEGDTLKIGDKVEVNLIVSSDRNMEYVYIRDQRAAGLEPLDVLSEYHWKNGLGFYQITKDASTGFFADFMPKGMYQFNYVLKIEQSGIFSSGIATAQCMYAPEYAANSVSKVLIVGE